MLECLRLLTQAVDILMAEEVIAVNQDELGVAGDLIWKEGPNEVHTSFAAGVQQGNSLPCHALGAAAGARSQVAAGRCGWRCTLGH